MSSHILPSIFDKTTSIDVNLRHGSVLAIGEIVLSLSEAETPDKEATFLNESLLQLINGLVSQFHNRGQYRGGGLHLNVIYFGNLKILEINFRNEW